MFLWGFLSLTSTGWAQTTDLLAERESSPADVGMLEPGTTGSRTVRLENVSDGPVRVGIKSKSCGCLSTSVEPEVLAPGAVAVVTFSAPAAVQTDVQVYTVTIVASRVDKPGV